MKKMGANRANICVVYTAPNRRSMCLEVRMSTVQSDFQMLWSYIFYRNEQQRLDIIQTQDKMTAIIAEDTVSAVR